MIIFSKLIFQLERMDVIMHDYPNEEFSSEMKNSFF